MTDKEKETQTMILNGVLPEALEEIDKKFPTVKCFGAVRKLHGRVLPHLRGVGAIDRKVLFDLDEGQAEEVFKMLKKERAGKPANK